jgi:hypothetical protein
MVSTDRPQQDSAARRPRSRRRTYALTAAGAVAVAAAAAGVTVALHPGPAAPSPIAAVTTALARTSAQSYTFSLDTTVRIAGRRTLNSDAVSGAFDPRHGRSTELLTAHSAGRTTRAQIRFIGASLYTSVSPGGGFGKLWDETPVKAAAAGAMPPGDLYGFVSDQPVSPAALTVVLRAPSTAVRDAGPASGPGWSGTKYSFTTRLDGGRESVTGTAYVDQQGRVRRLLTTTAEQGAHAVGKTLLTTDRDIIFGDFGAPVPVTAPPASLTKSTTGQPYWGFYF